MHLSRLFQRSVQMFPDRPALAEGNAVAMSYAQLDKRVRSLAQWMQADIGLGPGDRVVIAMRNCTQYAEAMLAMWQVGLCAVPVNNKLHVAEIDYVLTDSGAKLLLSCADLNVALAATSRGVRSVDVMGDEWNRAIDAEAMQHVPAMRGSEDLAWLFYTSGTTGRPKGVMLSHANLVAMALHFHADVLSIDDTDVLLHVAPMSHGGGLYGIPYWIRGGLQVVPASGGFDEAEVCELMGQYRNASFFASPTIVNRLVSHCQPRNVELPGLRCIIAGGAPFYVEDLKAAVRCFGPRVAQMYGQGETPMTISAIKAPVLSDAVERGDDEMLASVGYAQTAMDVDILDGHGKPVPVGEIGEIVVGGPTVMSGYWNNGEATLSALIDGGLHTGDIGMIDTRGLLHLKDRSKDVIISGGSNIYPREVEEALLHHPGVKEVAVVGMSDVQWGEAVVAIVVAQGPVPVAELDAVCVAHIARFKRPKRYIFVDALPKNATGKVLRAALRALSGD